MKSAEDLYIINSEIPEFSPFWDMVNLSKNKILFFGLLNNIIIVKVMFQNINVAPSSTLLTTKKKKKTVLGKILFLSSFKLYKTKQGPMWFVEGSHHWWKPAVIECETAYNATEQCLSPVAA